VKNPYCKPSGSIKIYVQNDRYIENTLTIALPTFTFSYSLAVSALTLNKGLFTSYSLTFTFRGQKSLYPDSLIIITLSQNVDIKTVAVVQGLVSPFTITWTALTITVKVSTLSS